MCGRSSRLIKYTRQLLTFFNLSYILLQQDIQDSARLALEGVGAGRQLMSLLSPRMRTPKEPKETKEPKATKDTEPEAQPDTAQEPDAIASGTEGAKAEAAASNSHADKMDIPTAKPGTAAAAGPDTPSNRLPGTDLIDDLRNRVTKKLNKGERFVTLT